MHLLVFRLSAILLGAVAALTACSAENPVVPSQQNAAQSVEKPTSVSRVPLATRNCYTHKYQPYWIFKGPCFIGTITQGRTGIKLPPYKRGNRSVALAIGPLPPIPYVLVDAYGNGDISAYDGRAFPAYNGGKGVVIYIQGVNKSQQTTQVEGNILLSLTSSTGYPGTHCGLAFLDGTKWVSTPAVASPKGDKLLLTISGAVINGLSGLKPGPLFTSVYC